MKKLLVMTAAMAIASLTQAASCTWASGGLKIAASADGGWGSSMVNAANALVTMNIYFLADQSAYDALASKTMKELYADYKGATANLTGQNKNASDTLIGAVTISDANAYAGNQYAVAIATYHDATYDKDMYIATRVMSGYNSVTSKGSAANIISGVSGGWEAVPEPTSGLLMLLGFAGLALRRKRA